MIENPEKVNLILDLRSNYGGDTESAMNILDYLIGNSFLGEWESPIGENVLYYSDGIQYKFKHIFVLVDSESASSSEIVTLGIREYLENETVVGETTFGKGVGQISMSNLKYEYALFVVNAYWTVNNINIHQVGIQPDILLTDGSLSEYLEIIRTY